jgi:molybdopterin molybdotransferase
MLTFDQAKKQLLDSLSNTHRSTETITLHEALGRVLASDVYAQCDVPFQDNSAMDGFAVCCADVRHHSTLPISQKIFAGAAPGIMQPATAVRLFTGSVVPPYADAVVPQEDCAYNEAKVTINEMPVMGQHIRKKGEDIQMGQMLLKKGVKLQPKHIAYMVAGGLSAISVFKILKVGVLATGDEICEPGSTLAIGQIYNSNQYMLSAELQALGFVVQSLHVRDDVELIKAAFVLLCENNDVVLSIGGVSVGDADFVKQAISELGDLNLWKVAMKPGKPLSYGKVLEKPIIGLPGNPVSAFATYHLFAKPYLLQLQGIIAEENPNTYYPIQLTKALNPKREEFLRVQLQIIDESAYLVPFHHQGSGVISSVVWATGFARIPKDQITQSGNEVAYIPFV